MSDIFHCASFLGWHRHKNGWLDPWRKHYINQATDAWYATLSPLSTSCGSMVVLAIDDATRPSKAFVIELAQPLLGTDNTSRGEGILVYTVDATVPSLQSPLVILPRTVSNSDLYGALYEAPYGVGDDISFDVAGASLGVKVIQKFGSSYNVRIRYRRSSDWIGAALDKIRDLLQGLTSLPRYLLGLTSSPGGRPLARELDPRQQGCGTVTARAGTA